jgi:prolyl-tRNA synthetase
VNSEIVDDVRDAPEWKGAQLEEVKAIEVGNIFQLGTRFSDACSISVQDAQGAKRPVLMGCYGIGSTRLLGTIVEVHHDERGIRWPEEVAPFDVHLVSLARSESERSAVDQLLRQLDVRGVDVLLDEGDVSAGQKFADSDLIGIPIRAVVSANTIAAGCVEVKRRTSADAERVPWVGFCPRKVNGRRENVAASLNVLGVRVRFPLGSHSNVFSPFHFSARRAVRLQPPLGSGARPPELVGDLSRQWPR